MQFGRENPLLVHVWSMDCILCSIATSLHHMVYEQLMSFQEGTTRFHFPGTDPPRSIKIRAVGVWDTVGTFVRQAEQSL